MRTGAHWRGRSRARRPATRSSRVSCCVTSGSPGRSCASRRGAGRVVGDVSALGLPQSVREVTGRRVERLGADARATLSAAAVIGRDFDLELLLAVVDLSETQLLDLLDERSRHLCCRRARSTPGASRSPMRSSSTRCTRISGTPAALCFTGRIAQALEEQCGSEPGERARRARRPLGGRGRRQRLREGRPLRRRAGERALEQLAPDEAARWYRQALELHDHVTTARRTLRAADRPRGGPAPDRRPGVSPDAARRRRARPRARRHATGCAARCSPTAKDGSPPAVRRGRR